ncbi:oxidoreductase [Cupriavidus necator]|uniref:Oxidoreductase n=1 Tax=Cupriavidus necator TaxID=106590 RepID=A0A1U9UNA3_CUPNE|nr:SDR family oxidoreductase [Cupriavidus necator]AQV94162.1 oxidoreductase [Cupriavidus necator]
MKPMLDGKVIVVTGAARGIGRAAAYAMAQAGASLALADFDEDGANTTAAQVARLGARCVVVRADVSREEEVAGLVNAAVARFGRLDGAFNNAGIEQRNTPLHLLSEAQWNAVNDVNLKGVFFCLKHEIRAMLETGGGAIVNTSSALGRVAIPNAAEYCASKGGVLGLSKAAAVEYGSQGIRVNAILPGVIRTPMIDSLVSQPQFAGLLPALEARHPIGRLGEPDEIAQAAVWLLSDLASFVNGSEFSVDGGYLAV